MQEDIKKIENKIDEIEQKSFAFTIFEDYKAINKRMFFIILILIAYCAYMTYKYIRLSETYGTETITEIADSEGDGNACIGEECNNGVINGKGN